MPFARGVFALWILYLTTLSLQVLAIERRTANNAGQQQQQQWYQKGWKTAASSASADTVYIDDPRLRQRISEGSGRGAVGDLDDTASGYGEDDEDSDMEGGSGAFGGSRVVDVGSGDDEIMLPPKPFSPVDILPTDSTTTWPSSSTTRATTTSTTANYVTEFGTTTEPSFIGPVITPAITGLPATTTGRVEDTTPITSTRLTPSSAVFTMRPTTTTEIAARKRPTTTTKRPTVTISSTVPGTNVSPGVRPPSVDDTTKPKPQNFWMRPGVLAGLIGGAVAGLLAAVLLVIFVVYRMRKKDEGSYALEEPKSPPNYAYAYQKAPTREFYA